MEEKMTANLHMLYVSMLYAVQTRVFIVCEVQSLEEFFCAISSRQE